MPPQKVMFKFFKWIFSQTSILLGRKTFWNGVKRFSAKCCSRHFIHSFAETPGMFLNFLHWPNSFCFETLTQKIRKSFWKRNYCKWYWRPPWPGLLWTKPALVGSNPARICVRSKSICTWFMDLWENRSLKTVSPQK